MFVHHFAECHSTLSLGGSYPHPWSGGARAGGVCVLSSQERCSGFRSHLGVVPQVQEMFHFRARRSCSKSAQPSKCLSCSWAGDPPCQPWKLRNQLSRTWLGMCFSACLGSWSLSGACEQDPPPPTILKWVCGHDVAELARPPAPVKAKGLSSWDEH